MSSNGCEERADNSSFWCAFYRQKEIPSFHHARFQPCHNGETKGRYRVEFCQQCLVVNAVEAFRNVAIQHKLPFVTNAYENGFDCIVTGAPWPEPVTVRFKDRFPFGFQGKLQERLFRSVLHGRDTQGPLYIRRSHLNSTHN